MSQNFQKDYSAYERDCCDVLEQVAKKLVEYAENGDGVGMIFILDSLDAMVSYANALFTIVDKRTGNV